MAVIDHGFWVKYIPVKPPEDVPRGAAFIRREKDGQDWYEYVNVDEKFAETFHKGRIKRFEPGSVKCVIETKSARAEEAKEPIVRAAAVDETRLFPQDCQLIELTDVKRPQDEEALIEEFVNRRIDLKTGKLGARWEPKPPPMDTRIADALEKILERLERLEKK